MLGVALEAALVSMTRLYPRSVYKQHGTIARPWALAELITISATAGWLRPNGVRAAKRLVRWRNLVHADRFARGRSPSIRRRTVDVRLRDFELITGQLYDFILGPGGLARAIERLR